MNTEHTDNKLYWQSDLYPNGQVEVQLTLGTYADNDNLYAGLIAPNENLEDGWEPFTNLTINQHSLPPFHAYVDNRDYNKGVHAFLIRYGIAVPDNLFPKWNGFKLFRFNSKRLEELAPEYYKVVAKKLPSGKNVLEIQEKELLVGKNKNDTEAEEIYEYICHYSTEDELKFLTDAEMIEKINCGTKVMNEL